MSQRNRFQLFAKLFLIQWIVLQGELIKYKYRLAWDQHVKECLQFLVLRPMSRNTVGKRRKL